MSLTPVRPLTRGRPRPPPSTQRKRATERKRPSTMQTKDANK